MATQVQRRRGTASEHNTFTGAAGEVTVNTTNDSLHVHDGATAGGIELSRADGQNANMPTSAMPDGSVIQVVRGFLDTTPSFSAGGSTYVDVGLDASITPNSASSKILIHCSWSWCNTISGGNDNNFRLLFNDNGGGFTDVNPSSNGVSGNFLALAGNFRGDQAHEGDRNTVSLLHSPASSSILNYKLQVITEGTVQMNRGRQSGSPRFGSAVSEIILMEIAG